MEEVFGLPPRAQASMSCVIAFGKPFRLAQGSVALGVMQAVTLISSGTSALTISAGSAGGAAFNLSGMTFPATLNPGQTAIPNIRFHPLTAGPASETFKLTGNAWPKIAAIGLSGAGAAESYQVNLNWTAPTGSADPVADYLIYRGSDGNSSNPFLNSSSNSATTYTDIAGTGGSYYTYYVEGVYAQGNQRVPSITYTVSIP